MLNQLPLDQLHHRALVNAGGAAISATVSIASINAVVQVGAGILAGACSLAAATYYIILIIEKLKARK